MNQSSSDFWAWFVRLIERIPDGGFPEPLQDELLSQLHRYDDRLFFLASTSGLPRELIITAEGNKEAFSAADDLVADAPQVENWRCVALKPPMGFDFRHTDGPISLDVPSLWFMPMRSASDPSLLGVVLGFPDADFVLRHQSVDTAYTILESAIGERACMMDIAGVTVGDVPDRPQDHGYLPLPQLPDYIAFHKSRNQDD